MTHKLENYFKDYMEYHQTSGNQICHFLGIPMITLSLLGMLSMVTFGSEMWQTSLFRPDLGLALLILGLSFYFYIDWKIALPFALVLTGFYFLGRTLPIQVLVALQVLGWIFQYIGHLKFEQRSPAFYKNLAHVFIGPLWVFSKAVGYAKL